MTNAIERAVSNVITTFKVLLGDKHPRARGGETEAELAKSIPSYA